MEFGPDPATPEPIELVTMQCPDCGPGLIPLASISFRINLDTEESTMAFACTQCGRRSALRLSQSSVAKLRLAGIEPDYWHLPDELLERRSGEVLGEPLNRRHLRRQAAQLVAEVTAYLHDVGTADSP